MGHLLQGSEMKKLALALCLIPSLAWGQAAVRQDGAVTRDNLAKWSNDHIVKDVGGVTGDNTGHGINPFAVQDSNGQGICVNSAATSGAYAAFCLGHDSSGNALITIDSYGGAPVGNGFVRLNGTQYPIVGTGAGNVTGPNPSTAGNLVVFNNVIGSLIGDVNVVNQPVSVASNNPLEGIYATGTGAKVSMCPGYNYGCPDGGAKILSQFAAVVQTLGDPTQNESAIYSFMKSNTGEVHPWVTLTGYSAGAFVFNGLNLYKETTGTCTSGASGPTGKGTAITDGTCVWNYVGPTYAAAKQSLNFILDALAGSGSVWGAAGGAQLESGYNGNFATAAEIDLNNFSGTDPGASSNSMLGMYLGGPIGTQPISAMLYIGKNPNGTNFGSHEGIWIIGAYGNKDHDIRVSSQHTQIGYYDEGAHAVSSIFDFSTSPVGLTLGGNYSSSALDSNNAVNIHRTVAGLPFNALLLSNNSSVASTSINLQLATGTASSFATIGLTDASQLAIFGGAGLVNGVGLTAGAGPLALNTAASAAIQLYTANTLRGQIGPGGGFVWGAPTGSDKGAGTINIQGTIWTNGVQGVASKTCTVNQALTLIFTNGLLTGGTCAS